MWPVPIHGCIHGTADLGLGIVDEAIRQQTEYADSRVGGTDLDIGRTETVYVLRFLHYPLEVRSRFGENFENFLSSTPLWRWEKRFDEVSENFFVPHIFPLERKFRFERKFLKLFLSPHH